MRYINVFLSFFRSEAVTVGLSPKALSPWIGVAITGLVAALGLSPHDIGEVFGVSDVVVAAGEVALASKIAVVLLGPGTVVRPVAELTDGSDARLSPEAQAGIQSVPVAVS